MMTKRHRKHGTLPDAVPGQPTKAAIAVGNDDRAGISEEDIRLCAYQKWEAAGKPSGDGVRFWLEAEQELVEGKIENSDRQIGWRGQHEHERPENEKAVNASKAVVDGHHRDHNRMLQNHGEQGHRHGSH